MKTTQSYIVKKMVDKMISDNAINNLGIDDQSNLKGMIAWAHDLQSRGRIPSDWLINKGAICILGDADLRGESLRYPIGLVAGHFIYDGPSSLFEPTKICNIDNYRPYPPIKRNY